MISNDIIGLDLKSAEEIIKSKDLSYRIVRIDDTNFIITHDLKLDRLNLEIENGVIVNCYGG